MKLYHFSVAPNPARVVTYVEEKGIELERVSVNLVEGEQRKPGHLARNPSGALPVLELDDGECLTESLPIIEYLEELYPEPVMIGRTPLERARTRSFERSAETSVLLPIIRIVHATRSPLGLPPSAEVAGRESRALAEGSALIDARLGEGPFAMGEQPTIVDCTLFAGMRFGKVFGVEVPPECAALREWYRRFSERHP